MMKVYDFYEKRGEPFVVMLGFFDCMHVGHGKLIDKAKELAERNSASVAVFTFKNDMNAFFSRSDGLVLDFTERLFKIERLGIESVITCDFDGKFSLLSAKAFLDTLFNNFNLKGVVCGYDYTFGLGAAGNALLLKRYTETKGVNCVVVEQTNLFGERVSTTLIKKCLKDGFILKANELLGEPYYIYGLVVEGRKQGRTIGFPTANILLDKSKLEIKHGVYKTRVIIDGKEYYGVTNYGGQPTFGEEKTVIETHVKGFNGDLYGKKIFVIFLDYIRDIIKFSDTRKLTEQLKKDMEALK